MVMVPDLSRFLQLGFSGRAVLLCGQDLEPGTASEEEQQDARSLNLDPDPIIRALTRVCGHYYDDGGTDYDTWAEVVRREITEEIEPCLEKAWEAVTGKPLVNPKRTMSWNEIRNIARILFNVWVDQPEMKWVRIAWRHLRAKGLTSYGTEVERTMVLVRLGTLSLMYREFCNVAFDEGTGDFDFVEWDRLGIEPSRLAQLVETETEPAEQYDEEAEDGFDSGKALQELSERVRPGIYEALKEGLGNDSMLFASLWRTVHQGSLDDILNNELTGNKLDAFMWICEGMGRLH